MSQFTSIMETGNAIVALLRENLVPDTIMNPDSIGLCSPDERGDILLGVHLYDVRESEELRGTEMINIDSKTQRYPSSYFTLSYMITAYSAADAKFKSMEEHKIIGKVLQVLADNGTLKLQGSQGEKLGDGLDVRIVMMNLSTEEKQKLWQFPNLGYKMSLHYKASPVEVQSERFKIGQRVIEAEFIAKE